MPEKLNSSVRKPFLNKFSLNFFIRDTMRVCINKAEQCDAPLFALKDICQSSFASASRPFALAIFFALMFLTQDVKTRQLAIVRIVA